MEQRSVVEKRKEVLPTLCGRPRAIKISLELCPFLPYRLSCFAKNGKLPPTTRYSRILIQSHCCERNDELYDVKEASNVIDFSPLIPSRLKPSIRKRFSLFRYHFIVPHKWFFSSTQIHIRWDFCDFRDFSCKFLLFSSFENNHKKEKKTVAMSGMKANDIPSGTAVYEYEMLSCSQMLLTRASKRVTSCLSVRLKCLDEYKAKT